MFYFNHGSDEIQVIKGDRRAIGGYQNESIKFQNHQFTLVEGSTLYLGTDGFVDQNNYKRKRLGTNKFVKILKETAFRPLNKQKEALENTLTEHMKNTLQRDDILLVGIKL